MGVIFSIADNSHSLLLFSTDQVKILATSTTIDRKTIKELRVEKSIV